MGGKSCSDQTGLSGEESDVGPIYLCQTSMFVFPDAFTSCVSGLSIDLSDPFDIEDCRCEVNKFGFNGRDRNDCLLPAFPNNWVAGQEVYIAFYGDFRK